MPSTVESIGKKPEDELPGRAKPIALTPRDRELMEIINSKQNKRKDRQGKLSNQPP